MSLKLSFQNFLNYQNLNCNFFSKFTFVLIGEHLSCSFSQFRSAFLCKLIIYSFVSIAWQISVTFLFSIGFLTLEYFEQSFCNIKILQAPMFCVQFIKKILHGTQTLFQNFYEIVKTKFVRSTFIRAFNKL